MPTGSNECRVAYCTKGLQSMDPGIPAVFLNPESRDCLRPNPGIFRIERLTFA